MTQSISVNSQSVPVTQNLHAALRHLQSRVHSQFYWVDVLCINQDDIHERNMQIPLMADIYSRAETVIVWLGSPEPISEPCLDSGNMLLHCLEGAQLSGEGPQHALTSLSRNPWFTRSWTVQEAVAARNIYMCWGEIELDFYDLSSAVSRFVHKSKQPGNGLQNATTMSLDGCDCAFTLPPPVHIAPAFLLHRKLSMLEKMRRSPTGWPLIELCERFSDLQTTDPRDQIYALLGLASDTSKLGIVPDYSRSTYEVFTFVATRWVEHLQNLYMLTLSFLSDVSDILMPSWVPNWSSHTSTSRIGWGYFSASRNTRLDGHIERRRSRLYAKGICLDTVKLVTPSWSYYRKSRGPDNAKMARDFLLDVRLLALDSTERSPYERTLARAVWVTSTGGLELSENGKWQQTRFSLKTYRDMLAKPSKGLPTKLRSRLKLSRSRMEQLTLSLSIRCRSRVAFATGAGYLGLGPDSTRPGDIIAILFGSNVPFVLRRDRDDTFLIVGECYVYGMMDGQVMDGKRQSRNFVIA